MNTKKTSVFQNALIWFGAGVSIAEILTGTYFAPLGMARGLAAILVGHIIGCVMLFLAGYIGAKSGRTAMETVKMGGECIIIADHGNVEEMFDEQGTILTKHTTNKVPFILVSDKNKDVKLKQDGSLANVAPTILELMGIAKPNTMIDSMIVK